jgi:hypothetical protein
MGTNCLLEQPLAMTDSSTSRTAATASSGDADLLGRLDERPTLHLCWRGSEGR